MILTFKLEPQEAQLAISAIQQSQFYGKNAHTVSATLRKFEKGLENVQQLTSK